MGGEEFSERRTVEWHVRREKDGKEPVVVVAGDETSGLGDEWTKDAQKAMGRTP